MIDYLVVGAGFAGATIAERLAADAGKRVIVCDRRPHVGGNAYDHYDEDGILVHKYGPHIFHTNSREVFDYLSQFTEWRPYQHRVLASVDGQLVPIPINLNTINGLYGIEADVVRAGTVLRVRRRDARRDPHLRGRDRQQGGRELYEKFFRNYTRKQWGLDPSELDAIGHRASTRANESRRPLFHGYVSSHAAAGYTRMFERMLAHPNIMLLLDADYRRVARWIPYREMIYTGPIDEFFDYRFGKLPYRSLQFRFENHNVPYMQDVAVINYPNDKPIRG